MLLSSLPVLTHAQDIIFPEDSIEGIYTNSPVYEMQELILHANDGTEFLWTGPNNFYSTDKYIRVQGVDPSYTGTYYLTLNDSVRDTTLYFSVYVEVMPLPAPCGILCNNVNICEFSNFYLECTVPGFQYTWSSNVVGSAILNLPQNTLVPNITLYAGMANYGTYPITVEVKDQNGNLITQCTTYINIMDCCLQVINPQWVTVLDNTTISSFSGMFTEPTIIKGALIIDVDYAISASFPFETIRILEKGSIIVEENKEFRMENLTVTGCNRLWKNILVLKDSKVELNSNKFSLAYKAVKVMLQPGQTATLNLRSNTFVDNKVALSLEKGLPLLQLYGNTFTSASTIPMDYSSRYGIQALYCPNIEINGASINEFSNLQWGILSVGSNLLVRKNAAFFVNMTSKLEPNNFNYGGVGIAKSNAEDAVIVIEKEGNDANYQLDFENCKYAIGICDGNLIAKNNRVVDCQYGIMVTNCGQSSSFVIEDNKISCHHTGIKLTQNDLVSSLSINRNFIELKEKGGRSCRSCISILEDGNVTKNAIHEISFNELDVKNGLYGIEMNGVLGVNVRENTIYLSEPSVNEAGILLQNCAYDTVQCNYLQGVDPSQGNTSARTPFGILAAGTQYTRYLFNYLYDTYTGIGFQEDCYNSDIQRNQFHEHHTGLYYNPYAQTSPQERKGNAWNANCANFKAENLSLNPIASYYTYGYNCNPCDPTPSIFPSQGWFYYDQLYSTPDVEPPCSGQSMMATQTGDTLLDELDYAIAQNTLGYPDYHDELMWQLDRGLFSKLDDNPALINSDPVMNDFYSFTQNASAGLFETLKKQARLAMVLPTLMDNTFDSLKIRFLVLRSGLSLIDSLLYASPEPDDSLAYLASREEAKQDLLVVQHQLTLNRKAQQVLFNQQINPIITANNSLPDTSMGEANEVLVNSIYYSTITKGICKLTDAQVSSLLYVASQCPLAGGNAVYRARSLYALVNDTVFNDRDICLEAGYVKSSMHKPLYNMENNIRFSITPNPNAGECRLSWTGKSDESMSLQLTDLLGRVVYTRDFSSEAGELFLDLRSLSPGMYIAVVKGKGLYQRASRLIINK